MADNSVACTWQRLLGGTLLSILPILLLCGSPAVPADAQSRPSPAKSSRARRPDAEPRRSAGKSPPAAAQTGKRPTTPGPIRDEAAQVVAVVNGVEITREHLANECIRRFGEQVLESEVNKRLILAECKKRDIKVTAGDIEAEVERMAGKFGLPKARWLAMLKDERNISATQYRRDIVWPTLALRRLAAGQLTIADEELARAYESEYGPMVQTRMIALRDPAKAKRMHEQLVKHPEQFDKLAKDHSEDENSAAARGLIPPVRRHVGDPNVERAVFALKEGEVSPIVKVAGQHLIFRCERHLASRELGPEQHKLALEQLRDSLSEKKLRSTGQRVFKKLQDEAEIVNVYNDPEKRKQLPGVAATVNGEPITMQQLGEQCILRHGTPVLEAEINRALLTQSLNSRSVQVSKSDVNREIQRAAESFGYLNEDGSPDVKGWLRHVTEDMNSSVDIYVRDAVWPSVALKKLVDNQVEVTEEDLQKGFAANYGERVEVLAIVMSDQRTAHEVFDLARKNPSEKFFGQLASQYSIEPISKANNGQVPPIRRFGGQPLLEKEAFSLKPGETSGIIAVTDKYVLLRCIGRTKPIVAERDVVQGELENDIREKKLRLAMTQEFDQMRKRAQIDNFLLGTSQSGARAAAVPASYSQPVR